MMNVQYKTYRKISAPRLRQAWKRFEESDASMSPFFKYDYVRNMFRFVRWCIPGHSPIIGVATDDRGEILMIAPLKKDIFGDKLRMLGDILGCGRTDFLFDPKLSRAERAALAKGLLEQKFGTRRFKLRRIDTASPLNDALAEISGREPTGATTCVHIEVAHDPERVLSSLSKSVRQNLRTAYNRLERDGHKLDVRIWLPGDAVDREEIATMLSIYQRRLYGKYRPGGRGALARAWSRTVGHLFHRILLRRLKHDTRSLRRNADAVHAAVYSDGRMMAFLSGFLTADHERLVVPRLAIDDRYKFYSPGYILIAETLKRLPLAELDLSRGTEKYKFDMGGTTFVTNEWVFRPPKPGKKGVAGVGEQVSSDKDQKS